MTYDVINQFSCRLYIFPRNELFSLLYEMSFFCEMPKQEINKLWERERERKRRRIDMNVSWLHPTNNTTSISHVEVIKYYEQWGKKKKQQQLDTAARCSASHTTRRTTEKKKCITILSTPFRQSSFQRKFFISNRISWSCSPPLMRRMYLCVLCVRACGSSGENSSI